MANPNIVQVSRILANTVSMSVTTTANPFATPVVNNPASSGKVYKVNTIILANIDGTNNVDATLKMFSQDDLDGTGTAFLSEVTVPINATLVALDKNSAIYVKENQSIGVTSSIASGISVTASWEEISE